MQGNLSGILNTQNDHKCNKKLIYLHIQDSDDFRFPPKSFSHCCT